MNRMPFLFALLTLLPSSVVVAEDRGTTLYDASPDHSWNQLHEAVWVRRTKSGAAFGRHRIDPLLWAKTTHLTQAASIQPVLQKLQAFLDDEPSLTKATPLRRAIMQHDLWSVFDWLANRENRSAISLEDMDRTARKRLKRQLVVAIRKLALSREQLKQLPNMYSLAVSSKAFATAFQPNAPYEGFLPPKLLDKKNDWVGLGVSDGSVTPAHVRGEFGFSRSAFTVFIRLPEGRDRALAYLRQLSRYKSPWVRRPRKKGSAIFELTSNVPQFPPGTQVVLLRRMFVIDREGRIAPTNIVQQLQIRVYTKITPFPVLDAKVAEPPQRFFEFILSRAELFAGKHGLHSIGKNERDFHPVPFSSGIDPFMFFDRPKSSPDVRVDRNRGEVLQSCAGCHRGSGVLSMNSYTREFGPRGLRSPRLFATGTERAEQMVAIAKRRRYDWGLLMGLWDEHDK